MTLLQANGIAVNVETIEPPGGPAAGRPTAVLVHGLAGDTLASWYFTLAPRLARAGLRVVMYDLRGHGRTERPSAGYRFDDFVDDLGAVVGTFSPDRPVLLVGNSFGAPIAFGYAIRRPDRLAGLVSIDSSPPTREMFRNAPARLRRVRSNYEKGEWTGDRQTARLAERTWKLADETTLERDLEASVLPDPARFSDIACPVLAFFGQESPVPQMLTRTRAMVPQAEIVVVPGAGHGVLFQQTGLIADRVTSWLPPAPDTSPEDSRGPYDHSQ